MSAKTHASSTTAEKRPNAVRRNLRDRGRVRLRVGPDSHRRECSYGGWGLSRATNTRLAQLESDDIA